MKRKKAKELLAESFRELAEIKNIDKITVAEIAENCGYSPATFYRNYKDKYDLIAWDYAQRVSSVMDWIGERNDTWRDTLLAVVRFYRKEQDYLTNLFIHTAGQESFVRHMTEVNFNVMKRYILAVSGEPGLDETTEMFVRIYCLGTVNMVCEWILGKYVLSPEELADIFERSLPLPLHPYLLKK